MMGVEVISQLVPKNSGPFPTHEDTLGKGGYQCHLTLAGRDGLPAANLKVGLLAYVLETNTTYKLVSTSPLRWQIVSGEATSLLQAVWYFDSLDGDDYNTGLSPSAALKTLNEYIRRVGVNRKLNSGQSVDLIVLRDMVLSDRLSVRVAIDDPSAHFGIQGARIGLLSGTLTNFTATNTTLNTPCTVTAAGLNSTFVGKAMYFPNLDAWGVLWKDLGSGTLCIEEPKAYGSTSYTDMTRPAVSNTEPFVIYDFTLLYLGNIELIAGWHNVPLTFWPGPFVIENIKTVDSITFNGFGGFYQPVAIGPALLTDILSLGGSSCLFRTCYFNVSAGGATVFAANIEVGVKCTGCVFAGGNPFMSNMLIGLRTIDSNIFNCTFALVQYNLGQEGRIGVFTTNPGPLSGIHLFQAQWIPTHASDVVYGVSGGTNVVVLARASILSYTAGFAITATTTGAGGRPFAVGGFLAPTSLMPGIMGAAGGSLPASAPCTTWDQLLASPFNGTAWNYDKGCGITTDTI